MIQSSVYPSYPEGAKPDEISKALIVSYAWTQDAERLGALINGDGTAKPELIKVVFRDLATVHGVTVEWLEQFYTPGDYFAWDWNHDPLTMGSQISLITLTTPLKYECFRCICVLWTRGIRQHGYLQRNASACSSRETVLRR